MTDQLVTDHTDGAGREREVVSHVFLQHRSHEMHFSDNVLLEIPESIDVIFG